MADEVRVTGAGNGNDKLEVSVKDKAVRIASQQLPLLFVIVVLAGFGYFMSQNMIAGQARGFEGLAKVVEQNNVHQNQLLEKLNGNQQVLIELVHTNRAQLLGESNRQIQLLHDQTAALKQAVDHQTEELTRRLEIMDYNAGREPGSKLPHNFPPEQLPRRQER